MRIRQRLLLGFLGVVAIFALFGGYLYTVWQSLDRDMDSLEALFEESAEHSMSDLDATLHMALNLEASRRALHEYLLGEPEAKAEVQDSIVAFDQYYQQLSTGLNAEASDAQAADDEAGAGARRANLATLKSIEEGHEHFQADAETMMGLVDTGRTDEAVDFMEEEVEGEIRPVSEHLSTFETSIEQRTDEAIAGFDEVMHAVEERMRQMQGVLLAVLGIAIVFAFGLGYLTAETISEPIRDLEQAATAVEQGTYELDSLAPVAGRRDELGQFARVFERMVKEVYAREQKLKEQVQALRIKIDQRKKSEQVAEIAGTDYFRDLQKKAEKLRSRSLE